LKHYWYLYYGTTTGYTIFVCYRLFFVESNLFFVFLHGVICALVIIPLFGHVMDSNRRIYIGPFTSADVPGYTMHNYPLLQKRIKELEEKYKV
jgi:hypothetical protein